MKRLMVLGLLFAVGLMVLLPATASAVRRTWSASFDDMVATFAPAEVDTSANMSTSGYDALSLFISYEGDSLLVTVQQSLDSSTWFNVAAVQCNGTDGTNAIQLNAPLTRVGYGAAAAATLTDFLIPPLNYTRIIANNNDTTGADTVGSLNVRVTGIR